ncbi:MULTISPECIES: HAD family hydrolase [unclassified Algibacter]|uniref:HAD family hydrolase n=1 Tax=unclassified Algibacter TaxID=2615009 RepID=UPI00131D87CB|nr:MULTISPECIES: HAD family hydrolase [unclassified Algibacter]MCL5126853.1 HAD family hydrolase [Algibacter sp. L4_22]
MNLSEVKLVVTDMDGTLLNNNSEVSDRFFKQFEELKKRNIHFVAASGRQYQSIVHKLETIKNEISIIAENGGLMQYKNEINILLKLSSEDVFKSIEILREIPGSFIVLCGRKAAYIETTDSEFISKFSEYYTSYEIVDDLTKVTDDDFMKIAVYHFESSEDCILPNISGITADYQVTVSGQNWLDISHKDANKGYALKMLQKDMGINKNETMVFGDYNNDLQMLELAYFSYAMENAHPNVKKIANFETKSNTNQGVESILEELINSKSI